MTIDIEDTNVDEHVVTEVRNSSVKLAKIINKKSLKSDLINNTSDSIIPEKISILVQTWGCAHNTSDSEYMAGLLSSYGYKVTLAGAKNFHEGDDDEEESCASNQGECSTSDSCCKSTKSNVPTMNDDFDLYLFNSCTVKGPAEDHFRNAVNRCLNNKKFVVVAGCVPQGKPSSEYLKNISKIGVQQIDRVVDVVAETLNGNCVEFLEKKYDVVDGKEKKKIGGASLSLPKIRRNPLIEILAVSTGCLNACTYCKTKHARGVLGSYTIEELVERAKEAFADGVREIWLTSEDLGAYGYDLPREKSPSSDWYVQRGLADVSLEERFPEHFVLADLLARLVELIPMGCMLRLGMTNPPYILNQLPEVLAILKHPRVYAFLHVPVQSGSDKVLHDMKREYTRAEFEKVCLYLQHSFEPEKRAFEKLTIATDIICGFPTEDNDDFTDTVTLVEKFKFPSLFINQFFARPGTVAANMKRLATTAEVKVRTAALHKVFHSYKPYADLLGRRVRILVTEISTDEKYWVGHTKAYQQVLVEKKQLYLGRIIEVDIVEVSKFFMRGKVVDEGPLDELEREYNYPISSDQVMNNQTQLIDAIQDQLRKMPWLEIAIAGVIFSWISMKAVQKAMS